MTEDNQSPEIEDEELQEQYYADFDDDGNIVGFYLDTINDVIPETAIPITEEEWQTYIEDSNKYKLDGDSIREKTQEELDAEEEEARPKPPPSRVETLETENAELWYEVMLEKSRNDNHDADIAQIYYDMMMGGVGA